MLRSSEGAPLDRPAMRVRKDAFDRYRAANAKFHARVEAARRSDVGRASLLSVATIVGLAILFGGVGYFVIDRHALVKQHLERSIPEASVIVLSRNNSANRLISTTPLPKDSPLTAALADAEPESSLSVRLAREYRRGTSADPLLTCDICGVAAGEIYVRAVPRQRRGDRRPPHRPPRADRPHGAGAGPVAQAAPCSPTCATSRSPSLAPPPTGSPASPTGALRALETLARMVAHAVRSVHAPAVRRRARPRPLQGAQRPLRPPGRRLRARGGRRASCAAALRISDFAGRSGGGGVPDPAARHRHRRRARRPRRRCARRSRRSTCRRWTRQITASLRRGRLSRPTPLDADTLVRMADRALYSAKGAGRNRVELAMPSSEAADLAALAQDIQPVPG